MSEATNIPDGLPTLGRGAHGPEDGQACVMEYVSVIAGEEFTDHPNAVNPAIAAMARYVNDSILHDDLRTRLLVPLICRMIGTDDRSLATHKGMYEWLMSKVPEHMRSAVAPYYGPITYQPVVNVSIGSMYTYATTDISQYQPVYAAFPAETAEMYEVKCKGAVQAYIYWMQSTGERVLIEAPYGKDMSAIAAQIMVKALSAMIDAYDTITGRTQPVITAEALAQAEQRILTHAL